MNDEINPPILIEIVDDDVAGRIDVAQLVLVGERELERLGDREHLHTLSCRDDELLTAASRR